METKAAFKTFEKKHEKLFLKYFDKLKKDEGKIAAICDEGIAGIGNTVDEALDKAEKKYPNKKFWVRKITKDLVATIVFL